MVGVVPPPYVSSASTESGPARSRFTERRRTVRGPSNYKSFNSRANIKFIIVAQAQLMMHYFLLKINDPPWVLIVETIKVKWFNC